MKTVICPGTNCGKSLAVTPEMAGRTLRCPNCKHLFRIGGTAETPLPRPSTQEGAIQAALPRPEDMPQQFGRFQVRAHPGTGAFGTVYRAYDPQTDREVALKVPLPGTLDDPERRKRFLHEARAAAQLRHPHIMPLFETGTRPTPYLASAYIEGRPQRRVEAGQQAGFR